MRQISGDYIYNQVLKLVDYCGDINKNGNSERKTYHEDFSPNNLRRLILSPDGAIAYFHVSTKSNPKMKPVMFSSKMVAVTQELQDYIPMTNVLSADRIFASIEEVILISRSNDGSCYLTSRELDFASLIKGYASQTGDLEQTIKKRYKRLYAFSVYNGTLAEFMNNLKGFKDSPSTLLCKQNFMQDANTHVFHKDDWYKGYGSSANHYLLDAEGSQLNTHFKFIIKQLEEEDKEAKIDAFKKERLGKLGDEYEKAYNNYKGLFECIKHYLKIRANGVNVFESQFELTLQPIELEKTSLCEKETAYYTVKEANGSEAEAVKRNIDALHKRFNTMYLSMLDYLLTNLYNLARNYPLTVKVMLSSFDRAVVIPEQLKAKADQLATLGYYFEGVRIADSVANICMLSCNFFASNRGEKNINKFLSKDYWMEVFKC